MKKQDINTAHVLLQDIINEFGKDSISLNRSRFLELLSLTSEKGKKYICPLENSGDNDAHIYEYEKGKFGIFIRPETDYEIFEYSNFSSPEEAQVYYVNLCNKLTKLNKDCFDFLLN